MSYCFLWPVTWPVACDLWSDLWPVTCDLTCDLWPALSPRQSQHWKENLKGGCSGLNLSVVLKGPKTGKTGSKATMTGCAPSRSICGRTGNWGKCYSLSHYWYWLHLPAEETPGNSSPQNLNYREASIMIATTSMCTTVLRIACAQDEP